VNLRLLAPLVVLFTLAAVTPGASATSDGALVLRNVTIVNIERKRLEPRRDVVIVGERIVGIQAGGSARAPKQGRVLDGSGKFLMPGLWDFHVHVFSAPGEEDFALPLYILNGITGVRDAGALRSLPEQQQVAAAIERGERVGPRLVLAGALIDGPPGSWPGQMVAASPDEGRQRVRESKAAGWGFIKSYSLLSEPTYLAIADEARAQRLPLYGHIPESVRLQTAVTAGHRSIEHFGRVTQACALEEGAMIGANARALKAPDPMPALMAVMMGHNGRTLQSWDGQHCAAVVKRLASAGVAVMPSLMVSDFYLGKDPAPDDPRLRSVPLAVRAQWGQGDWRRQQIPPELLAQAPKSVALDWKTFKMAHDAGVAMLAGTDAAFANPFLFHGYTLHDELQRYVEAGLTPQQALLTATVNPGRFLKRSDLAGRVGIRQKADLVLLDANPLADIAATRRIHAVVANGRLFDRAALDALQRDVETRAAK
jgi:cytosine/adenosine deaminase-related metal-dependent hydrolase